MANKNNFDFDNVEFPMELDEEARHKLAQMFASFMTGEDFEEIIEHLYEYNEKCEHFSPYDKMCNDRALTTTVRLFEEYLKTKNVP